MSKDAKNASPLVELNLSLENEYLDVISKGEDANIANYEFIKSLNSQMKSGLTQEVAQATLKNTAKGIKVGVVVKYGHIVAISTATAIIEKYESELSEVPAGSILTLASKVLADVKAKGVKAHLAKYDTLKELNENTRTKAESQADAKAKSEVEAIAEKVEAITFEHVIDSIESYLSATDLKSLTTTELAKLRGVIAKLITVEKNTKALTA